VVRCSSRWWPADPEGRRPRLDTKQVPDREDWLEGSFRFESYDTAVREVMSLGSEIEVLLPVELRDTMAGIGRRIASLHEHRPPFQGGSLIQRHDHVPGVL
jgi:predicted DNA-binding transcriptional regulator YafY